MFFEKRVDPLARTAYHFDAYTALFTGLYGGAISFVPAIARKIGASDGQLALISAAGSIGLLLTFFWTYISMHTKKMTMFVWPKIVGRGLFLLTPFVFSPIFFVGIVVLYSFLDSLGNPSYGAIMKEVYPEKTRTEIMGYVRTIMGAATALAAFIGGRFLDIGKENYKIALPTAAIFGIIANIFFRRIPVDEKHRKAPISLIKMFRGWIADKEILKLGGIVSVAGFGNLILGPVITIFLIDKLKMSLSFIGIMGSVYSIALIFAYYVWGKIIDKKGSVYNLRVSFLLNACVVFLYIIGQKWALILSAVFNGFAMAGWDLSWFKYICARTDSPEKVQIDSGFYFNLMGIRGTIAPFVGIWIMGLTSIRITFFVSIVLIITGFFLAQLLKEGIKTEYTI